jgi:hypothetical protein
LNYSQFRDSGKIIWCGPYTWVHCGHCGPEEHPKSETTVASAVAGENLLAVEAGTGLAC